MIGESSYFMQDITEYAGVAIKSIAFITLWQYLVSRNNEKKHTKKVHTKILYILVFVVEGVLAHIKMPLFPIWIVVFFVVLFVYCRVNETVSLPEATFLLFLYANIRYISYFFVSSLMDLISNEAMKGVEQAVDIETFVTERVNFMCLMNLALYTIVMVVFVGTVVMLIRMPIRIKWHECGYLSVLNVAGIILTIIMISIEVIKTDDGTFVMSQEKPELLWIMPLIALLMYLGELSAVYYWQKYVAYRHKSEIYYAESLEKETIKRRLAEVESYYEEIRKARHEMANHLTNIHGLVQSGKTVELSKYIFELDSQISPTIMKYVTGNAVTDVVINDQYKKAEEKGIQLNIMFAFDDNWGIPAIDISVVLSNLLNNAIKAADETEGDERYVELKTLDKDNVILIRCMNGYRCGGEGKKGNENSIWHGIGLKNVADIAKRFDGTVNIKQDENVFSISVLMKKKPSVT